MREKARDGARLVEFASVTEPQRVALPWWRCLGRLAACIIGPPSPGLTRTIAAPPGRWSPWSSSTIRQHADRPDRGPGPKNTGRVVLVLRLIGDEPRAASALR